MVINIVQDGDLVIAVDKDGTLKAARVSSVILSIASPVFRAMLSPPFREGQMKHDIANPLVLPDDNPTAILNLCYILHYKPHKVNSRQPNYLQKLAVVSDKYRCVLQIRDFFKNRLNQPILRPISLLDRWIILSLIGERAEFESVSEQVIRMPKAEADRICHRLLRLLLPENMLEDLALYREQTRRDYLIITQQPVAEMYQQLSGQNACPGSTSRLAAYYNVLAETGVLTKDVTIDSYLPDLLTIYNNSSHLSTIDHWRCRYPCAACDWSMRRAIKDAGSRIESGYEQQCQLCHICFMTRQCVFIGDCEGHGRNEGAGDAMTEQSR